MDELTSTFYPEIIGLPKTFSKAFYLQWMRNKYGDFKVTTSYKDEQGDHQFWKHRSISYCWEHDKGLYYLNNATHRTSLKCEIILDMDDNISIDRLNNVCDKIQKDYMFSYKAYSTGSKGYHIHLIVPELIGYSYSNRKELRKTLMHKCEYNMDQMKMSEQSMIALEGCPHWKTGISKKLVRSYAW